MSFTNGKLTAAAFLASFAVLLLYLPALNAGFTNWDDNFYVYENIHIRSIDLKFLKWVFTAEVAANWHPFTIISFAIDYLIMGLDPWIYHLTNIIFHTLNTFLVTILVFRLLKILPGQRSGGISASCPSNMTAVAAGFVTALLFGIHPLRVESVVWISERKDVLCAFFFLLSILSYIEYASNSKKNLHYVAAISFSALAIMSKPMAVSLPFVFLILDFYPLERFEGMRKRICGLTHLFLEKIPFFILSALSVALTIWAQHKRESIVQLKIIGLLPRILNAGWAYMFYLYKMIIPIHLAPFYPYPGPESLSFFSYKYAGSLVLFSLITVLCILKYKNYKAFLALWLYYVITLLPVIGVLQVGSQAAADRYTYLPGLGPLILVGAGACLIFEKIDMGYLRGIKETFMQKVLSAVMVFIAGIFFLWLSWLTLGQEAVWKDALTFWSHEIKEFPREAGAYNNRGVVYLNRGDYARARSDFDTTLKLNPYFALAYYNLGRIHQIDGDNLNAIKDFNIAMSMNQRSANIYNDRGISYGNLGQYGLAIKDFDKAIELDQANEKAYSNRGYTYLKTGDYNRAIADLRTAVNIYPVDSVAYYLLGSAYSKIGDVKKADSSFKTASLLKNKPVRHQERR